jgi:allantoinase
MDRVAIKSNYVVLPGSVTSAYVVMEGGIIKDIVPHLPQDTLKIIDVGDKVLMPGVIDPHVHINEPGRTHWEGFDSATKAAIVGGVTSLVDMPLNASPVTTTAKAFAQKLVAAKKNLHTNCGFWGGLIPGNENEIEPLIENGVLGFKAFLTPSGIDEFPNVTEDDLKKAAPIIAKYNLPLLVHCELIQHKQSVIRDSQSYQAYLLSRPKKWEDDAIALMIRLCEEFNCPVHIVHLSSANSIEPIKNAKERGLPLTVETAQHYLYFSAEEIGDGQPVFKCAPPIREKENNDQLWQALKDGVIDFVATDHSPAPPDLKQLETGDLTKAWGGIASLQWALPVLWTAAKKRGFELKDIYHWLCKNPARLIGKEFKKGKIEKGYDADLIVWDPYKKFIVTEDSIQHKHKITPYLHQQLSGVVEQTWLAGIKVFNKSEIELNKGELLLKEL